MNIDNSYIPPIKKEINPPAQKIQPQSSAPKEIPQQDTTDVSVDTLKAYAGIEDKNKKISREEVVEY